MGLLNPTSAIDFSLVPMESGGKPSYSKCWDSRPFTGVSAAGGIRPGIYAGLPGYSDRHESGPFTGLLVAWGLRSSSVPGRSPANGAGHETAYRSLVLPGVNAGPNTAFGGKGRKRPSEFPPGRSGATKRSPATVVAGRCDPIPNPQSLIPGLPRRVDAAAKRSPATAVAGRCDPISNPQSLIPNPRRAFTLIEMLIVISIMLIMVAAAATLMQPAGESRRIREAARAINVYLSTARNRAMETGRPCGVTFRNFPPAGSPGFALNADQCEVPPCYCGDTDASAATVQWSSAGGTLTATLISDILTTGMVRNGDLIQFNCQGPMYKIVAPDDGNGNITTAAVGGTLTLAVADPNQNPLTPWTTTASQPVSYRIFRSPIKGGATPLQLPAAAVVDLEASGYGSDYVGHQDLKVVFSPTGSVDCIYYAGTRIVVNDPIYLLIGKRERVKSRTDFLKNDTNDTTLANWQDLNNLWVTINVQTGQIDTEPMATSDSASTVDDSIQAARGLAAQGQGMGGK